MNREFKTPAACQPSRREFLEKAGRTSLGLAVATATLAHAQEGARVTQGPFIDVHTHITQKWGKAPELTAEGLLAWMDSRGILQAVVLPLVSPESWDHPLTTDFVLRVTEPYRDRLIPFCSIDPRVPNLSGYQAKVDLLKRYIDAGAKGFGEHKCGVPIDDSGNMELFKACAELRLPVLFHMDNERNMDTPGLPGLARVLEQNPEGVFIGHANGWWASISGDATQKDMHDYPRRPVMPGGAIDALMDRFPNLYGDLSAGSGANAIQRDIEFGRAFVLRRADRLLFGTDYLSPGQEIPQFDLLRELDLPVDAWEKVACGNARKVLGLA
ncbi:MAG: amidohydrolase family protein [Candidatus Hydrogenedentes bacterium]|nr:amidohydrolase family protein [Candidatus Hydrogenedentota bacterium]